MVQGIAVAHGGEARARNREPGGADVWLSVPRDRPAEPSPRNVAAKPRARKRAARRRTLTARAVLAIALVGVATAALVARGSGEIAPTGPERPLAAAVKLGPIAETKPVPHSGDAAHDPAIWLQPDDPARSTIIGTDKRGGIAVYDLRGHELQYLRRGKLDNVDLRAGFALGRRRVTLVAASDRSRDTVALYRVDERTRRLAAIGSFETGIDVYGLCMYRSPSTGDVHVIVDSERGRGTVEQYRVRARGPRVAARLVRSFDVGSEADGCVADDASGRSLHRRGETRDLAIRRRADCRGGALARRLDRTRRPPACRRRGSRARRRAQRIGLSDRIEPGRRQLRGLPPGRRQRLRRVVPDRSCTRHRRCRAKRRDRRHHDPAGSPVPARRLRRA